ncbi:MAG: hypothetical protein P8I83_10905 [Paracoccaceae bacterium]|nr:hypothetical protein [Paracoccaceae bacterium]
MLYMILLNCLPFMLLAKDKELVKTILSRAKKIGLSKKSLERVIRDPDDTREFISKLSSIGGIN